MGAVLASLFVLAEALGVAVVVLMLLLMGHTGGLSLNIADGGYFNLHPVLMTLGFMFLYGNAVMTFKAGNLIGIERRWLKLAHFVIQGVALMLAILALVVVFGYHATHGYTQMRTLHSWVGITTFSLFVLQFLFGFLFFLFPRPRESIRAAYKQVHVYFGILILGMVAVVATTGVTEQILFHGSFDDFTPVTLLADCFAMTLLAFIGIVTFAVTRSVVGGADQDGPGAAEEKSALMEMEGVAD